MIFPPVYHGNKGEFRKTMLLSKLFGKTEDAYWKGYDWDKALEAGMAVHDMTSPFRDV
ncbi:MAG: hypothetical protein ACLFPD_05490 [Desulfosudaceae bacterium]